MFERPRHGFGAAVLAVLALGCSDLIPDVPETTGATADTAVTGDGTEDLPDIGVTACESDDDCAHLAQCCLDVRCDGGTCMPRYVSRCCTYEGPCAVSSTLRVGTCEETCVARGCVASLALGDQGCDATVWELALTADGIAELEVHDDADDRVTWHLSRIREYAGQPALRAGDVLCPTYHTGLSGADCETPVGDAGAVNLSATTPAVALPAEVPSLVEMWLFAELPQTDGLSTPLDGLMLDLITETGPLTIWSTRVTPIPLRSWTPILVDMSLWAGQEISLRLRFETLDGRDNDYEGIALGRFRVRTACAADRTATDRSACEVAHLTEVRGLEDALIVFGAPDPTRACAPCQRADNCTRVDTCDVAECVAGRCQLDREITAECCTADARWPGDGGFESALEAADEEHPDGWLVDEGWALSELRSASGNAALRFGLADGSAIAAPNESAAGTILSPPITVHEDEPRWRFSLWLSTEWDGAPSSDNPAGVDLLEAVLLPDVPLSLSPFALWDSREIGGTTLGQWADVGIDLSAWAGKRVRLGWRFATGDADANEAEGVYIDDAALFRVCPGCDPGAVVPERPECAPF